MESLENQDIAALKTTPMLAQYHEIKESVGDAILFYRMGDFYEMFFDDALRAAPILDVQLTSRDKNASVPVPMCGVPHHSAMGYVQKLVSKGLKVALCEQVGSPGQQKGLLKREVTRIITPGLIAIPELVSENLSNRLVALNEVGPRVEIAVIDLLSGRLQIGSFNESEALADFLLRTRPRELLLVKTPEEGSILMGAISQLKSVVLTLRPTYFVQNGVETAIRHYVTETQGPLGTLSIGAPESLTGSSTMRLDQTSLSALEILEGHSPDVQGTSLFDCVNRCETALGRRLLKEWLAQPLTDLDAINSRLDSVAHWVKNPSHSDAVRRLLSGVRDLERLSAKLALGLAHPLDLVAVRTIQSLIPELKMLLSGTNVPLLLARSHDLDPLTLLTEDLNRALNDNPPVSYRDGEIFRDDFSSELSELRKLSRNAKALLMDLEARERERSGIATLKVKYNRVFGYSIEITKSNLTKIPAHFIRRQTLANAERFVTEELTVLESKILSASDRMKRLEEELFLALRARIAEVHPVLRSNARILAECDVLIAFSIVARERGYARPKLHRGWELSIQDGRHPVVESLAPPGTYVPNSISLHPETRRTLLVTGPNMAGKSTIMRQVALTAILAQCGSFIPGREAFLPIVEGIFTRIGASDDLAMGRSTFMVEMTEMTRIVSEATDRSLILIDEIGRGTSTYDGLSLAWSLLEYLHSQIRAKMLFATHFHELTTLEKSLSGLQNVNVMVRKSGDRIIFLHRLEEGACSQSYGIDVARLAGLPPKVLMRAKEIIGVLETQSARGSRMRINALESSDKQMGFSELN